MKKMKRFIASYVVEKKVFVLFIVICAVSIAHFPASAQAEPYDGYLMAHFTGESSNYGEQIYFATSTDGLHWTDVNNSRPVLTVPANLGDGGVRDPSLIRSADGTKFWILATDLCIGCGTSWHDAQHNGSTSLVIWESSDLVSWSDPWLADVAGGIPDAGCAWAPEAIYDEDNENYVVYWATLSPLDGVTKQRIYYVTTTDFVNFSVPQVYIERPGTESIIDTQIIKVADGDPYQYYRASRDNGNITIEGSNSILDLNWAYIGNISQLVSIGVEGPILYKFNNINQWCLMVDQYSTGGGYLPLVSSDLSNMQNYSVLNSSEYSLGASRKRHGSILNITTAELNAVLEEWPMYPGDVIESFVNIDFDSGAVTTDPPGFKGFDAPYAVEIDGWTNYPAGALADAGIEGPGAWWDPYDTNAAFMASGDAAYTMSSYVIDGTETFEISYWAKHWDWTGNGGEWTATLFYDDPANVIGSYVQGGLGGGWGSYSDATGIAVTPASIGGTLGILLESTGGAIAQIDEIMVFNIVINPPAAPTSLTATSGIGRVSLNWDDNIESDLDSYNVYRSQTSDGPYALIQDVTASEYVDDSVNNGTTYYYVVTATDTSDNVSGNSNEDSALPPDLTDDDKINLEDFAKVAEAWLTTYDMTDLSVVTENWLLGI